MLGELFDSCHVPNRSPPSLLSFVGIYIPPTAIYVGTTDKGYNTNVLYFVMSEEDKRMKPVNFGNTKAFS